MRQPPAADPGFVSRQVSRARRFYRDLGPRERPGLEVVSAGFERCARDYLMRRRSFPWYGLELVADGGGRLELAGASRELCPGLVFTYGPGIPHAIFAAADRPPGKWYFDLAGREAEPLLRAAGLAPGSAGIVREQGAARALCELIVETGCQRGREADPLLAALARALVQALAHPDAAAPPDAAQATWQRCRAWLDAHAGAGAGVGEAALALGLSPAYVTRLFKRFDRVAPGAHARRVRLQAAADRLAAGDERIAAIAAAAGYADAFHFSRAFSRAFGMPPRAFRALAR